VPNQGKVSEYAGNSVLSRLASDECERLLPHLEEVPLPFADVIYRFAAPIDYVYFPTSGVLSMLALVGQDIKVEVGMAGREGMAGNPLFLGTPRSSNQVIVQAEGAAFRLKAAVAMSEFQRAGAFHDQILLFTHSLFLQLSQTISCNRHHSAPQRLARWLLMMHDRVASDSLQLKQDFLSWMLGVRMQTINLAATELQRAGLIKYSRGTITILDRDNLEEASCGCYRTMSNGATVSQYSESEASPHRAWGSYS
jgi:CRP-like cAMP-binding protein